MTKVLLLLISFFSVNFISAQQFVRIENIAGFASAVESNGISVADYDGDLDLDVFVVAKERDEANPDTHSKLFRNNNDGTFTDVTAESGLTDLLPYDQVDQSYEQFKGLDGFKFGASWGDYDNDGFPDIFFTHLSRVQLFHNQGDGTFVEVTTDAGIDRTNGCGNTGATWFDYDNDSFLDLYIAEWEQCEQNTFYKNNGDGTFTDISNIISETSVPFLASFTPMPFDFDNNGWMDLYLSNDLLDDNQLFISNGFVFTEQAGDYSLNTAASDMGIAVSDYNLDGFFDFFVTAIDENFLQSNNGDLTFTDRAEQEKIAASGWAWGCTFADFDLDADEDLLVANGFHTPSRGPENNFYYENTYANAGNSFEENNDIGLTDFAISVEVVDFDYDGDGDLDVIISNADREVFFYENRLITDPDNLDPYVQWFKVSLEGTVSNRDAIGTIVELETTHGTLRRYYSGVGFLGQSLKPVHFGLNPASDIIAIKILWPSGIIEEHTGLAPNSYIKAIENQGYQVLDVNPADKPEGCTDPNSCNYDSNAVVDDGSCEYLNSSGSIVGPTSSGFFNQEQYSFAIQNDQSISWQVENGEIVSGHNSSTITVSWGFEDYGTISAVVEGSECISEPIRLIVALSIDTDQDYVSIARLWNEALLFCIRNDFARPTVHARNLFHTSAAMYDVWAIYNNNKRYLIGNELNNYESEFSGFTPTGTQELDIRETISYVAYRLLLHRFANSPHFNEIIGKLNFLMTNLGYNTSIMDSDYGTGSPAALGNFIAQEYINYGLTDGSRENTMYDNAYYQPINTALAPVLPGNSTITNPNRWQSLSLDTYIDQSGNVIEGTSIDFLSPEWGNVNPFAMTETDKTVYNRNGDSYSVYHDPLDPPYLNSNSTDAYSWGFSLVSLWSAHLDPNDGTEWDISPKAIGNLSIDDYPDSYLDFPQFYNQIEGGITSPGHAVNPVTGATYEPQIVPRGDYTRVLAEFWADGPDSETPPGHWFKILNTVNDHPLLEKKFEGSGDVLSALEWDIKSYFMLGGAMHDSAISAWSIKGWYDYIRPLSAIRYMGEQGQSTNPNLPSYNPNGLPLIDGLIELVGATDDLAGRDGEHIGKIKLFSWKGHNYIGNPETDEAGVDWILAEEWWPYQRPSFVTPPFAGYVSGHSTYSRAAAEILTLLTGSEFFPGGIGEFVAPKNNFLVFEQGPSTDVVLQWATYRDAADQCSLSRIWGGIHPPVDDIPGRKIGEEVGQDAFDKAVSYFQIIEEPVIPSDEMILFPNPVMGDGDVLVTNTSENNEFQLFDSTGRNVPIQQTFNSADNTTKVQLNGIASGLYILISNGKNWKIIVN